MGRCALDFVLEHGAHFVDKESPGPSVAVNWPLSAGLGICGTQISQPLYLWNVELRSGALCVHRVIVSCGQSVVWTVFYNNRCSQIFPVNWQCRTAWESVSILRLFCVELEMGNSGGKVVSMYRPADWDHAGNADHVGLGELAMERGQK